MSNITVWFIKAALIYLVLSMLLGLQMAVTGAAFPYRAIHAHLNLLGWISMMIYGVSYHILPRFSGMPLWSERLAWWHLVLANVGLIGMTLGWLCIGVGGGTSGTVVLFVSSLLEATAIIFFVLNMFKTVKPAPPLRKG